MEGQDGEEKNILVHIHINILPHLYLESVTFNSFKSSSLPSLNIFVDESYHL